MPTGALKERLLQSPAHFTTMSVTCSDVSTPHAVYYTVDCVHTEGNSFISPRFQRVLAGGCREKHMLFQGGEPAPQMERVIREFPHQ